MSEAADKIFIGTVVEVVEKLIKVKQGEKQASISVQEITFKTTEKLKGEWEGDTLSIRQARTFAQPVKKGEEVLMYLASESDLGLTAPLGLYSGHFKIRPRKSSSGEVLGKVAINLKSNEGLWQQKAALIAGEQPNWQKSFQSHVRETAKPSEANRVFQAAALPNRRGPLPLTLITAATEAFLETENQ